MNAGTAARNAVARIRQRALPIAEMAVAATLAWVIDTNLVGHPAPFFAPATALIVLGQTRGHRWRRAAEVVLGVAGGVLVADLVAKALGTHNWWTILVIVVLPLLVAAAVGASTVFTIQAAVSALYVAVIAPSSTSIVPFRFVDALVGGGVALVISQLTVVHDPTARLTRDLHAVLSALRDVMLKTADALEQGDQQLAMDTLRRARTLDASVAKLREALMATEEALLFHPRQRQTREGVRDLEHATTQLDYIVRSGRVLARAGLTMARNPAPPPREAIEALRALADVLGGVDDALTAQINGSEENRGEIARSVEADALQALRMAGRVVPSSVPVQLVMLIGQLRTMTVDMLRAVGADDPYMMRRVDDALAGT